MYEKFGLDTFELRTIAAAALVDVRTLIRLLSGDSIRPSLRDRVVKQLRLRQLDHLIPDIRAAAVAG